MWSWHELKISQPVWYKWERPDARNMQSGNSMSADITRGNIDPAPFWNLQCSYSCVLGFLMKKHYARLRKCYKSLFKKALPLWQHRYQARADCPPFKSLCNANLLTKRSILFLDQFLCILSDQTFIPGHFGGEKNHGLTGTNMECQHIDFFHLQPWEGKKRRLRFSIHLLPDLSFLLKFYV